MMNKQGKYKPYEASGDLKIYLLSRFSIVDRLQSFVNFDKCLIYWVKSQVPYRCYQKMFW